MIRPASPFAHASAGGSAEGQKHAAPQESGALIARALVACALLTVPSACGDRPENVPAGTSGVVVVDSAGVEIVDIPGAVLEGLPQWRFGAEPIVSIGQVEGEGPYLFSRVSAAARLASGEILVADGQSRELRIFDAQGAFLRSYGGRGEGPGEFVSLDNVSQSDGRRVSAFDVPAGRVTTIDLTDGSFTTAPRPPSCESADPERFSCGVIGALADGTVLAGATERLSPELQETPGIVTTTGATRQVGGLVGDRLSPFEDLRVAGSVRTMPGTSDFWSGIALWVPGSGFDMGAESIVAGDPHEYRLRVRSGDGTLRRIIRVHADPVPVTQSLIDTHRAWADTAARAPDIARAYLAGLEPEGTVPFFGGLTIDPAERIWVRDYRPFWAFGPTPPDTWTILSPEGTPIGRLEGGAPGSILEIGEDYVLLLERDEFDVEYVRMRRIEMPRSGGG